jgi:hypothetical protein
MMLMFKNWLGRQRSSAPFSLGEIVYADHHYRVSFRPGQSSLSVLAFCGVGLNLGGMQTEEFRTALGDNCSTYFIADTKRSWWNDGRVEKVIDRAISHALLRTPDAKFAAIGNSMGGCGALVAAYLDGRIGRCLAFAPQGDIRLSAQENQWMNYRKRIRQHRWPTFALRPARGQAKIVFGATDDLWHQKVFTAAGMPITVYEGHGHSVGRELRDTNPEEFRELISFALNASGWEQRAERPSREPSI